MDTSSSTTVMLIPDDRYINARPNTKNHHLTVAYFGKDVPAELVGQLRHSMKYIKRGLGGPFDAQANGVGIFNAGDGAFALVDLIDGIGTFRVRTVFEALYSGTSGLKIDYTHGFTPHITREYIESGDTPTISADMIDNINFRFIAIGVWSGNERYEITL